jgi:ADP-heptose:LPS heptosyltransferase
VYVNDNFSNRGEIAILEFISKSKHANLIKEIGEFDLYVDDSGYCFTAIAGFLARIRYRIGRNFQGYGFLYHYELPYDDNVQLIERRLKLLRPFGMTLSLKDVRTPYAIINPESVARVKEKLNLGAAPYFTIQPFSGWEAKNWEIGKFISVAAGFSEYTGLLPVFIGGESERIAIATARALLRGKFLNSAGSLDISESASLIAGAELHLGGDSVGAHIAAATRCKSLTIFGPTSPVISAYLGSINIAVLKKSKCTPSEGKIYCARDAGRGCPDLPCMKELQVRDVLRVLIDLWEGKSLPPVVEF